MTEGGCSGDEEGSNWDDVAAGAGAGAAGFMIAAESKCKKVLVKGRWRLEAELGDGIKYLRLKKGICGNNPLSSYDMHERSPLNAHQFFITS